MTVLIVGLDLGQKRDYSALVVAERVEYGLPVPTGHSDLGFHVRHVQRWKRGTPYTNVVEDTAALMRSPEMQSWPMLVFDATGVGGAVADLIHQAYRRGDLGECQFCPLGITFTAGYSPGGAAAFGFNDNTAHKGDVIARMALLLNTGRLLLPPGLPGGEDLEKELRAYQIKQRKTGSVYTEAGKESDHDDLVTALALAVWLGPLWGRDRQRYVGNDGELYDKPGH